MRNKEWTDEDITFLIENYHEMPTDELAEKLKRTVEAVRKAYSVFKYENTERKMNIYAYYKNDELIATGTAKELAEKLNLKENTIYVNLSRPTKRVKVVRVT